VRVYQFRHSPLVV